MSQLFKPTVLIVDDELPVRTALRRVLQATCEVVLAATPEEALESLKQKAFHIIISDVSVPPSDMRGPQLLAQVRKDYPDMIRLIMSGNDGPEAQAAVVAGVAEAFLPKPFDVNLLDQFVARARANAEKGKRMSSTILIVDPDEVARAALRQALSGEDYRIVERSSGHGALAFLQEHEVDLIITEYLMTEMNGLEFLKYARMLRPEALRIMLTGHGDLHIAVDAINEGAVYRFVLKPWDVFDLRVMIKLALQGSSSRLAGGKQV